MVKALHDRLFVLALVAALPFWAALLAVNPPEKHPLSWIEFWQFCGLVFLKPICEEIIFRGLIQSTMANLRFGSLQWKGLSIANVLTSLLFTGLHLFNHAPIQAGSVLLPSLVFGFFRDRHHGLSSCMALHIFYNAGYFLIAGSAS